MKAAPLKQTATKLLTLLLVFGASSAALAEPYTPPAGLGAPARRESAGTRGCLLRDPDSDAPVNLVALMPEDNVGWTTSEHPRFYWYMPFNQASFVEFTLERPAEVGGTPEVIYQTRLEVTGEGGIMSLQIPEDENIPPLTVGDRYRWQVAVFCSPNSSEGEIQVDGWVERQSPDASLQDAIATASDAEQAGLYASNGYWFDALDQLAMLKASDPDNSEVQSRWEELLTSVNLATMACQSLL